MTNDLSTLTKEDVQAALEAFLQNGNSSQEVDVIMGYLEYAKDKSYWEFPNGKSLGFYDSAVFEKAMGVLA